MDSSRMAGAVVGGVLAGLGITALLIAGERKSGKPSELTVLERKAAEKLGLETPPADALPSAGEQAVVQGGHLLLSAAAAATYVATTRDDVAVIPSGVGFGLAFYGAMHWIVGPLIGVKQPEWRAHKGTIGLHGANHLVFGLLTAAGAQFARRR